MYLDQQTLKLQENPEDVPAGEMPRNMVLLVERTMVQQIVPGTRVTLLGIYSIHNQPMQKGRDRSDNKGAVAIRQTYLHVVGVERSAESTARRPTFSDEASAAPRAPPPRLRVWTADHTRGWRAAGGPCVQGFCAVHLS